MLQLDHELVLEFKERLGFLMAIGDRGHYAQIGQTVNQNATYLARICSDDALWHFFIDESAIRPLVDFC